MKAARFYDRGDIRIEDIPEPKVLPGTVGIQVAGGVSKSMLALNESMIDIKEH